MPSNPLVEFPLESSPQTQAVSRLQRPLQPAIDPAAARQVELRRYRDSMAVWLSGCTWRHYAVLTDAFGHSAACLLRQGRRFVRRLESKARCRVDFFLIVEGAHRDPHLHVLLRGTDSLTVSEIEREWRLGWTCVRRFNPERGAASYVAKELAHAEFDTDLYDIRVPREPGEARTSRRSRSRRH
jgi:hypothetical protein